MAKDNRKEYVVEIGGLPHTFLLSPEDAERYPGAKPGSSKELAEKAAAELRNKSVQPDNK